MTFLYFLPGHTGPSVQRDALVRAGLSYCLPQKGGPTCQPCSAGPGGEPGLLFTFDAVGGKSARLAYSPDAQVWRRQTREGVVSHVGFWNEQRPTPATLVRERVRSGEAVEFADGSKWVIPYATVASHLGSDRMLGLPQELDVDDDGHFVGTVASAFRQMHADATLLCDFWFRSLTQLDCEAPGPDLERRLFGALMGTNYRVSPIEMAMLGGLTSDDVMAVLRVGADIATVEQWLGKAMARATQPADPSHGPGDTDLNSGGTDCATPNPPPPTSSGSPSTVA